MSAGGDQGQLDVRRRAFDDERLEKCERYDELVFHKIEGVVKVSLAS